MMTQVAALPNSLLSLVIGEHRDRKLIIMVVRLCMPRHIRFKHVNTKIYLPLVESQLSCILTKQEKVTHFNMKLIQILY